MRVAIYVRKERRPISQSETSKQWNRASLSAVRIAIDRRRRELGDKE